MKQVPNQRFGRRYDEMTCKPMRELLDYLHADDFKVFVVSGGGMDFIRVFAEEAYGIPPERVIGSSLSGRPLSPFPSPPVGDGRATHAVNPTGRIMTPHDQILELKARISQSIIGQEHIVERLIIGLLANGNLLVEGLPGLAKTRAVKALARAMDTVFSRIQFTPDLLPSDITGTEVYHTADGKGEFRFDPGPIFANIVLADEINRAPAKVQAALLEAMEERQVTVGKITHKMPDLFMVMATQNPIEQEGTYPLPEAQMDRFLMHVYIDYPEEASEALIMRLVRGEEGGSKAKGDGAKAGGDAATPIPEQAVFDARVAIHGTHVSEAVEQYIVQLVTATRHPDRYGDELKTWIQVGASPRGTIGLDKCARVHAWLREEDYVTPDNVRAVVHDVLRHRIILSYEANAAGVTANDVISEIVKQVAVA